MSSKTSFLAVISTVLLSVTTAQAAFVENNYICEDAYMEVAYECGNDAVAFEKSRLNKIYMSVYRTLSKPQKSKLDQEQIAWLKTRNDKCDFNYDGPMNNTVVYAQIEANVCTANESQQRSKELAKRYGK